MNILLIGSGAREHAIAKAFKKSSTTINLFCFATSNNPGILEISSGYTIGKLTDLEAMTNFAQNNKIDLAFVGPEAPLSAGVADELWDLNIPCVGPRQKLAQLESSKGFTRDLTVEYNIPGSPKYKRFDSLVGVPEFLNELGEFYVIKADGLAGGKGVKVSGDHLHSHEEAISYCQELIAEKSSFVIEEKFIGQEFSLMSFCDGEHLAHMPAVQDHKRAYNGDLGPNTGGMGSFSDANHLLPFLTKEHLLEAQKINQATAKAIKDKLKQDYRGILYGGFMATKNGVKLIEYNARFGDPESINVLSILESDFLEICLGIVNGNLNPELVKFKPQATVCKYAVPDGYPDNPIKNQKIDTSEVTNKDQIYYASVDQKPDGLYETGSRTVAVVGIASTIFEAEKIAEQEINKISGPLFHRTDIGTKEILEKKIKMMDNIDANNS